MTQQKMFATHFILAKQVVIEGLKRRIPEDQAIKAAMVLTKRMIDSGCQMFTAITGVDLATSDVNVREQYFDYSYSNVRWLGELCQMLWVYGTRIQHDAYNEIGALSGLNYILTHTGTFLDQHDWFYPSYYGEGFMSPVAFILRDDVHEANSFLSSLCNGVHSSNNSEDALLFMSPIEVATEMALLRDRGYHYADETSVECNKVFDLYSFEPCTTVFARQELLFGPLGRQEGVEYVFSGLTRKDFDALVKQFDTDFARE